MKICKVRGEGCGGLLNVGIACLILAVLFTFSPISSPFKARFAPAEGENAPLCPRFSDLHTNVTSSTLQWRCINITLSPPLPCSCVHSTGGAPTPSPLMDKIPDSGSLSAPPLFAQLTQTFSQCLSFTDTLR